MTNTQTWLAQDTYDRLQEELTELLRQRASGTGGPASPQMDGRDNSDHHAEQQIITDQRERDSRIRKLQQLLRDPLVGQQPPDDGVAEPGMVLTVRYEDDLEIETFLLAHTAPGADPHGLMTCSPDSPLGLALSGARENEKRQCVLPDGNAMQITLLRAVPYAAHVP